MVSLGELEIGLRLNKSQYDAGLSQARRDLEGFATEQVNQIKIVPLVDHRPLAALNQHLDKKLAHVKSIQSYLTNHPLTLKADTSALKEIGKTVATPKVDTKPLEKLEKAARQTKRTHKETQQTLKNNTLFPGVDFSGFIGLKAGYSSITAKHKAASAILSTKGLRVKVNSKEITKLIQDLTSLDRLVKDKEINVSTKTKAEQEAAKSTPHSDRSGESRQKSSIVNNQLAIELLSQLVTTARETLKANAEKPSLLSRVTAVPRAIYGGYLQGLGGGYAFNYVNNALAGVEETSGIETTKVGRGTGRRVGRKIGAVKTRIESVTTSEPGKEGIADIKEKTQQVRVEIEALQAQVNKLYSSPSSNNLQEATEQLRKTLDATTAIPTSGADVYVRAQKQVKNPENIAQAAAMVEAQQASLSESYPDLSKAKRIFFVSGGFAGQEGKSSHGVADSLRNAIGATGDDVVIPIENVHSDLSVPVGKNPLKWAKEAITTPSSQGLSGVNQDAITMVSAAMAARNINPDALVNFVGYSGGGFVSEEATRLANAAGMSNLQGIGLATPGLIGKTKPANYNAYLGDKDPLGYAEKGLSAVNVGRANERIAGVNSHDFDEYIRNEKTVILLLTKIAHLQEEIADPWDTPLEIPISLDEIREKELAIEQLQEKIEKLAAAEKAQITKPPSSSKVSKPFKVEEGVTPSTASVAVLTDLRGLKKQSLPENVASQDAQAALDKVKGIREKFKQAYASLKKAVKDENLDLAQSYAQTIITLEKQARADIDEIVANLKTSGADTDFSRTVGASLQGTKGNLKRYSNLSQDILKEVQAGLNTGDSKLIASAQQIGHDTGEALTKGAEDALEIKSPSGRFIRIGKYVEAGLVASASSLSAAAQQIGHNTGEALAQAAEKALEIRSRSRRFMRIGKYVSEGFATGLAFLQQEIRQTKQQISTFATGLEVRGRQVSQTYVRSKSAQAVTDVRSSIDEKAVAAIDALTRKINDLKKALNSGAGKSKLKEEIQAILNLSTEQAAPSGVKGALGSLGEEFESLRKSNPAIGKTVDLLEQFKEGLIGLVGLSILSSLFGELARSSLEAALSFEQLSIGVRTVAGGNATQEINKLIEQSDRLGISLSQTAAGYLRLANAAQGTTLEPQVGSLVEGFQAAIAARQISPQKQEQVFVALEQIISKGTVSLEEFRGQLSEALPSALSSAAKAMGVTNAEFIKMVETGNLLGEDLLPKLATQLKIESSLPLLEVQDSPQANINRLSNSYLRAKQVIGEQALPVISGGANLLSNALKPLLFVLPTLTRFLLILSGVLLGNVVVALTALILKTQVGVAALSALRTAWSGFVGVAAPIIALTVLTEAFFAVINKGNQDLKRMAEGLDKIATATAKKRNFAAPEKDGFLNGTISDEGILSGFRTIPTFTDGKLTPKTLTEVYGDFQDKRRIESALNSSSKLRENLSPVFSEKQFKIAKDKIKELDQEAVELELKIKPDTFQFVKQYLQEKIKEINEQTETIKKEVLVGSDANSQQELYQDVVKQVKDLDAQIRQKQADINNTQSWGDINSLIKLREELSALNEQRSDVVISAFGDSEALSIQLEYLKNIKETIPLIALSEKERIAFTKQNNEEIAKTEALLLANKEAVDGIDAALLKLKRTLTQINDALSNKQFETELKQKTSSTALKLQRARGGINDTQLQQGELKSNLSGFESQRTITRSTIKTLETELKGVDKNWNNLLLSMNEFAGKGKTFYEALNKTSPETIDRIIEENENLLPQQKQYLLAAKRLLELTKDNAGIENQLADAKLAQKQFNEQQRIRQDALNNELKSGGANRLIIDETIQGNIGSRVATIKQAQVSLDEATAQLADQYRYLKENIGDPIETKQKINQLQTAVSQAKQTLSQQAIDLEDYFRSLAYQIEDFNLSLTNQEIDLSRNFRSYRRSVEDANIQALRESRGLKESYEDLMIGLAKSLKQVSLETETIKNQIISTKLKTEITSLTLGNGGSIARRLGDIFSSALEKLNGNTSEKAALLGQVDDINQNYLQTMRQIRGLQEQQVDMERQRLRTQQDFLDQLKDLQKAQIEFLKSSRRQIEEIIRGYQTEISGRASGGGVEPQLGSGSSNASRGKPQGNNSTNAPIPGTPGSVPIPKNLRELRSNPRVKAFLDTIGFAEGAGYNTLFGGSQFTDMRDHPMRRITAGGHTSSASGKYQIMDFTWLGLKKRYGFKDFSPATQDTAAINLIKERGALQDVLMGRFDAAIAKLGQEWASFPSSTHGQSMVPLNRLQNFYRKRLAEYGESAPLSSSSVGTNTTTTAKKPALPKPAPDGRGWLIDVSPEIAARLPREGEGKLKPATISKPATAKKPATIPAKPTSVPTLPAATRLPVPALPPAPATRRALPPPPPVVSSAVEQQMRSQLGLRLPQATSLPTERVNLAPVPKLDYEKPKELASQYQQVQLEQIGIKGQLIDAQRAQVLIETADSVQSLVTELKDGTIQLSRSFRDTLNSANALSNGAKGYLTIEEQITQAVSDRGLEFDRQIEANQDTITGLERAIKNYPETVAAIEDKIANNPELASILKGELVTLGQVYLFNIEQAKKLKAINDALLGNKAGAQESTAELLRQQKRLEFDSRSSDIKAQLAEANYDQGNNLFNQAPIIRAEAEIAREQFDFEEWAKQFEQFPEYTQSIKELREQMTALGEINLEQAFDQANPFINIFEQGLSDLILSGKSLTETLGGVARAILTLVAQEFAIKPLSKLLGGLASSLFGYAEGGEVSGYATGGLVVPNYAAGSLGSPEQLWAGVHKAMLKERSATGQKPVLAVLSEGEEVLSIRQAKRYRAMQANKTAVNNYASGGAVKSSSFSSNPEIRTSQGDSINNYWEIKVTEQNPLGESMAQVAQRNAAQIERAKRRFG